SFKPANDYLDSILKNNTVSAFSNWKALALNDTFTVLANDNAFAEFEPDYNYFEMLYLRCLVQEYYCFSRNNAYREGKRMSIKNADAEIDLMVKYYFYDDMSYDFLPPLMYGAMVKGLGLEGDRHELIGRVKQDLREQRSSRNDRAVAIVKIFAMLTVVSALGEMIKRAFDCLDKIPWFDKAVLASAVLLTVLFLWLTSRRRRK
ncbi:MAG: hypothetical protein J6031_06985, partial [Bacteroidales bacterium]|nr:hypothetical protein [Bacteroidales bacterium]